MLAGTNLRTNLETPISLIEHQLNNNVLGTNLSTNPLG
jgi:hypothetical protein